MDVSKRSLGDFLRTIALECLSVEFNLVYNSICVSSAYLHDQGDQHGGLHVMNLNQVFEKTPKWEFFLQYIHNWFLKYAYILHILINQFVNMKFFWWHFADSSKLLKNHLIAENLNEVHWKNCFQKFRKSAKCHQKIPRGQTDGSKCLAYFKTSCESTWKEILIFVFFFSVYLRYATLIPPMICVIWCGSIHSLV